MFYNENETMQLNDKQDIKKFLIALLIVAILAGIIWILPKPYDYNFNRPVISDDDRTKTFQSIGKFSTPNNYELKAVEKGRKGENAIGIYVNNQTGQKLMITALREHLPDKLDKVQILDRTQVQRTFQMDGLEITKVPSFRFTYLLPFIRKDDLSGMGDEAIVKGITVKREDRFETAFADILYVNGEFTKIGLYKDKKGIWNYPTPVFDFKSIHDGALAFVKSKKSGKVYVCVSANGMGKYHDEEFQVFLQNFEPE
jgi:hypothetical protein